jgi:hypothetical protein
LPDCERQSDGVRTWSGYRHNSPARCSTKACALGVRDSTVALQFMRRCRISRGARKAAGVMPLDRGRVNSRRPSRSLRARSASASALTIAEAARAILRARAAGRLTADQERAAVRALHRFERRRRDSTVTNRPERRIERHVQFPADVFGKEAQHRVPVLLQQLILASVTSLRDRLREMAEGRPTPLPHAHRRIEDRLPAVQRHQTRSAARRMKMIGCWPSLRVTVAESPTADQALT